MEVAEKYHSYFSSRGVAPCDYSKAGMPGWLKSVLQGRKDASIIELGCGFGQNIAGMMNAGYTNVHGLDISDEAIAYCREKELPVEQGDILKYNGPKYDFVLMAHVLEHLPKESVIPMLRYIRENMLRYDIAGGGAMHLRPEWASADGLLLGIRRLYT